MDLREVMRLEINRSEIYRYLGIRNGTPDERVKQLTEECIEEITRVMTPRFMSMTFPLRISEDGLIDMTCFTVNSKNLARNLNGCSQVILFAATIGSGVDQLIRRYTKLEISKGVVMQAAGAAVIEAYCNEQNQRLKEEAAAEGYYLRPRFSPGYGDFPLEYQRLISDVLKMEKNCGITLTDSLLMLPTKSVTAVIGMGKEDADCVPEGCEACSRHESCQFSRVS